MVRRSVQAQNILHRVNADGLVCEPKRSLDRAAGEYRPIKGLVADDHLLEIADKAGGMLTYDAAAPKTGEADVAMSASAIGTRPVEDRNLAERLAPRLSRSPSKRQRRS